MRVFAPDSFWHCLDYAWVLGVQSRGRFFAAYSSVLSISALLSPDTPMSATYLICLSSIICVLIC